MSLPSLLFNSAIQFNASLQKKSIRLFLHKNLTDRKHLNSSVNDGDFNCLTVLN